MRRKKAESYADVNIGDGRRLEIEFFGLPIVKVIRALTEASRNPNQIEKMSFPEALRETFRGQGSFFWDPEAVSVLPGHGVVVAGLSSNTKLLAQTLFQGVRSHLSSLIGEEKIRRLRLYRSVGSHLDFLHGVDGFFEWYGSIVLFDITAKSMVMKLQEREDRDYKSKSDLGIEIVTGEMLYNPLQPEFQALCLRIAESLIYYSRPEQKDIRDFWGLGDGS